ncbi:unnamed protein product [Caenorhabditis auriculariae]|uniref:K Homology domain-containing protein n=1 Tax=Caenorhabditis auriculariae TaxID=2777116 RepID=A0A8S1GNP9_9PELO|nr:unnamed protein product [Caenorhabditis auriculariae]
MLHHSYELANDFKRGGVVPSSPLAQRNTLLSIDQQLQLMNAINNMVRAGQFTSQLANTIFTLCAQLKTSGVMLEQSHKNELNKVFVSLRQACCRDNGQLGTPCRLKIMELVELRAMHWRSNLAHSQYYVNRPEQHHDPAPVTSSAALPMTSSPSNGQPTSPVPQQMPFVPQSPMFLPQDMGATNPGFYLIPAGGGWMPPLMPGGMVPPNPFLPQPMMPHEAVLMRQRSLKKPNPIAKALQLRHEMIIRNSDSGKIMGVKGRRVALVEQITNTVISFQKVDPKSKERTLTITASSMEDIEKAKDLIIDTIRRNMSPVRHDTTAPLNDDDDDFDEEESQNDISIETTQDGMLKLCCADPEVLQAAQEALSEYLRVRTRPSAEEREKRKERRKSMPLQQSQPESNLKPSRSFHGSTPNLAEPTAALTTTVVMPTVAEVPTSFGEVGLATKYDRAKLMAFRDSSSRNSRAEGNELRRRLALVVPEILRL